jgi:hypothetical protein
MKIAVLSESPADEAALFVLLQGLRDATMARVFLPTPKTRGWHAVLGLLRPTLIHLHYETDAEGLVVTVDSDESPVHQRAHEQPGGALASCRLCELRRVVAAVQSSLRARQGRGPLKVAAGLAVPAVEAWYLARLDPHVTESTWIQAMQARRLPYTKHELKRRVYGTDRPSLVLEEECATRHARQLVETGGLPLLERLFPSGFGALADAVRTW